MSCAHPLKVPFRPRIMSKTPTPSEGMSEDHNGFVSPKPEGVANLLQLSSLSFSLRVRYCNTWECLPADWQQ